MKIIIIEDERVTATDLQKTLLQIDGELEIVTVVTSVEEGIAYFASNPAPDLIFSDIRLGDGLSFEILEHLQVPVIFCTAYDEYALNAFKVNGIDYILKPFTLSSVSAALNKFKNLTQIKRQDVERQYEIMKNVFGQISNKTTSLLIHQKDMIFPIKIADVAVFHLDHDLVSLTTFDNKVFYPNKTLEELEQMVTEDFFRVNRQYLINKKAVVHASSILSRKLSVNISVPHKETITISKEKAPLFLKWLAEG